jgi:hypothetical protein
MLAGVILLLAFILTKNSFFGFDLAGPIIFLPWTGIILSFWFRPGLEQPAVILWCKAIAIDIFIMLALCWPFVLILG